MKINMPVPLSVFAATVKFRQSGRMPYISVYIYACSQEFIHSVSEIITI